MKLPRTWMLIMVGFAIIIIITVLLSQTSTCQSGFTDISLSKYIDVVYYINLDKRQDRNVQILAEIDKMGLNQEQIIRVPAHFIQDFGALGCSYSHIDCLRRFIESGKQNCIILEDDYEFQVDMTLVKDVFDSFFASHIQYDVCMLSMNPVKIESTIYSFLKKVFDVQTASGYMVHRDFAKKLLANYEEGAELLKNSGYDKYHLYAIDQYWKKLQPASNWYAFNPTLGKQRESYSDIGQQNVNYGI